MSYCLISKLSKCILVISVLYFAGCSSSSETRYEQKSEEKDTKIEPVIIAKTMEVRERELVKKLKISSVDRISFEYDSKGKLVNKGKLSTVKYDAKGFLIETISFDKNGRIQNRFEYKYDANGFRKESLRYNAQNKFDKKYTYEYDEVGNKIKSTRYDMNENAEKYYEYDYDSNLNLISDEWYDISGDLEFKIETSYDGDGNKTSSSSYDENGKLSYKYDFKYDDKNIIIEEHKFNASNKLVGIIQYLYKYY
jgi:hypothetical protein